MKITENENMNNEKDPSVQISGNAVASVQAALSPRTREDEDAERQYDDTVASCVEKPGGHVQWDKPDNVPVRLYTVTTIAASARYGGTRTVVVCDSFEAARAIVEKNYGDIWECSYMLAVIEAVAANQLYRHLDEQYWYRWVGDRQGGYQAVERPARYRNVCGFGIG